MIYDSCVCNGERKIQFINLWMTRCWRFGYSRLMNELCVAINTHTRDHDSACTTHICRLLMLLLLRKHVIIVREPVNRATLRVISTSSTSSSSSSAAVVIFGFSSFAVSSNFFFDSNHSNWFCSAFYLCHNVGYFRSSFIALLLRIGIPANLITSVSHSSNRWI